MAAALDHYEVLMVPRDAGPAEIRAAFRSLIRRWHPDRSTEADAQARAAAIVEAYRTLSRPERRRAYDRRRSTRGAPSGCERRGVERRRTGRAAPPHASKPWRALALAWAASAALIVLAAAAPLLEPADELPVELIREAASV